VNIIFMVLIKDISQNIIKAMKAKEAVKLSTLRMLLAALKNKKIELKQEDDLNDEQVLGVIKTEVKKRKDSIIAYKEGGRDDLAKKENSGLEILGKYMPEQVSEEAVKEVVKKIVANLGDVGPTDFGRVMGAAMKELKGQADGTIVSEAVKQVLNS